MLPIAAVLVLVDTFRRFTVFRTEHFVSSDRKMVVTEAGAVAAPTAGLHFDAPLLAALAARGVETGTVTLHVGAGTFLPVKADDTEQHKMHAEWGRIDAATADRLNRVRSDGGRLVAVGKMASESATVRVQTVYWKQVDILGSSMGSSADFGELLAHVEASDWAPAIDSTYPLHAIHDAYARLDHAGRTGKVLLDVTGPGARR